MSECAQTGIMRSCILVMYACSSLSRSLWLISNEIWDIIKACGAMSELNWHKLGLCLFIFFYWPFPVFLGVYSLHIWPIKSQFDLNQAKLDEQKKKNEDEEETMSAMQRFRSLDKRGQAGLNAAKSETTHENAITQLSVYEGGADAPSKISSSGLDGKVVVWNIKSLEQSISDLKIV